jgi:hypothetical protein
MAIHVRQELNPTVSMNSGSLCGLSPDLTQAGYNPAWDLVYRLDTWQAVRLQDVCPTCLGAIQTYKNTPGRKRPKLP